MSDEALICRVDLAAFGAHPLPEICTNRTGAAVWSAAGAQEININREALAAWISPNPYVAPIDYTDNATIDRIGAAVFSAAAVDPQVCRAGLAVWFSKSPYVPPPPEPNAVLDRVDLAAFARRNRAYIETNRTAAAVFSAETGDIKTNRTAAAVFSAEVPDVNINRTALVVWWSKHNPFAHGGANNLRHVRLKR